MEQDLGIDISEKYVKEYNELKAKHKKVSILKVPLNDEMTEHAVLFLKAMDRAVYSSVNKMLEKDELQATQVLINSLWIGGDAKDLVTVEFETLQAASFVCGELLKPRKAELKKN